jgi:hypothetical protein
VTEVERYAVTGELTTVEEARRLLEQASSPQEVKRVADFATAIKFVAKKAELGLEAQNQAAELKLDAQRKGGGMLIGMELNNGRLMRGPRLSDLTTGAKLEDLGLTKYESSLWQVIARIPEDDYEQFKAEVRAALKELTTALLIKVFSQKAKQVFDDMEPDETVGFFERAMHDCLVSINSANRLGGVAHLARSFDNETKEGLAKEFANIADHFQEWANTLRTLRKE